MKRSSVLALGLAAGVACAGLYVATRWVQSGFSARAEPSAVEAFVARNLRQLAVPRGARELTNPVPLDLPGLAEGHEHFAAHCAFCHGRDGRGDTRIGRNLYPKPPDLRAPWTQSLSDGELFYIIQNGVRFTGMPAFAESHSDTDSWELVRFIRKLPELTPAELAKMKELNPRSRHAHGKHESGDHHAH